MNDCDLLARPLLDAQSDNLVRGRLLAREVKTVGRAIGGLGLSLFFSLQVNFSKLPIVRLVGAIGGCTIAASATAKASKKDELEQTLAMRELARVDAKSAILEAQVKEVVRSPEALLPSAAVEYQPKLFDWSLLRTKPNTYAHIAIVAPTGGGKTVTGEWLGDLLGQGNNVKVITTKNKSNQWRGMQVCGTPRDFESISIEMESLKEEMIARMGELDSVETKPQLIRIFDELAAMTANIEGFNLGMLVREARETGIRVIALCHGEQVKLLGLEGESDTAEGLTWVRLGKFAIKHARKLVGKGELSEADLEWLKTQDRPCTVNEELAVIPDLSGWCPSGDYCTNFTPVCTSSRQIEPADSHQLEALLHQDSHQFAPALENWIPADPFTPLTDATRALVWDLHRRNWSQNKILVAVWKCQKGSNKTYAKARELYLEILGG